MARLSSSFRWGYKCHLWVAWMAVSSEQKQDIHSPQQTPNPEGNLRVSSHKHHTIRRQSWPGGAYRWISERDDKIELEEEPAECCPERIGMRYRDSLCIVYVRVSHSTRTMMIDSFSRSGRMVQMENVTCPGMRAPSASTGRSLDSSHVRPPAAPRIFSYLSPSPWTTSSLSNSTLPKPSLRALVPSCENVA